MVTSLWRGSWLTVIVALNGPEFASEDDWAAYMTVVRGCRAEDPMLARTRNLALSDGGSPTARQRREVIEATDGARPVGAIVSTSRLVRGVGVALSWFMPEVKFFAPGDYRRALRHIGVPDADEPGLWRVIEEGNRVMRLEIVGELVRADR
jgi:hypothetical protein